MKVTMGITVDQVKGIYNYLRAKGNDVGVFQVNHTEGTIRMETAVPVSDGEWGRMFKYVGYEVR